MRLLFILLCTTLLFAEYSYDDTLLIPTDTTGPLQLPNYFYDEITLLSDSTTRLPAWRFYKKDATIRFEHPVKKGTILYLHYKTTRGKLKQSYKRYTLSDSLQEVSQTATVSKSNISKSRDNSITFSGEKGITFSTGSSGGTAVEQTLDISLAGKISEEITISGHISDQSTSLQGDSKEVGELDRIYLNIGSPKWNATVGDIEKRELPNSLLEKQRSPKGGRFFIGDSLLNGELYGGISASKQASQTFSGISGIQSGIYTLSGEGTEGSVYIVNNSVTVSVDGKKLTEGQDEGDYFVDYENSSIVFTNRFPIENGQRIEVQYQYKNSEYEKFTLGGSYEQTLLDSTLFISGELSLTGDNFESNERGYSKDELALLANAGDSTPYITSGKKVNPKDILKEATRYRLYRKDTLLDKYEWEAYPATVGETYPLYIVNFRREESSEGTYLPYSPESRDLFTMYEESFLNHLDSTFDATYFDPIYLFVGAPLGTHTPKQKAILPERVTLGQLNLEFSPSKQFSIYTGIIGKNHDKNTQSEKQDSDNNSGFINSFVKLSTPVDNMLVTSSQTRFSHAPGSLHERKRGIYTMERIWGLQSDSTQYLFWSEELQNTLNKRFNHQITLGQLYVEKDIFSEIIENKLSHQKGSFSQYYSLLLRREKQREGRRQEYSNTLMTKAVEYELGVEEEWFTDSLLSKGYIKGSMKLHLPKLQWKHEFKRKHDREGFSTNRAAEDTAVTTLWSQQLKRNINKSHTLELHSTVQQVRADNNKSLLLLYGLRDNARHNERDISSQLNLSTTMESALTRIWEYLPVPKGTGTHIKDSLTGTYLESSFGDYLAKEVILFGNNNKKTVRNRLDWNWHSKSRTKNRTLDGLRFNGTLRLSEDIQPEKEGISQAWIPSFTTFSTETKDSLIYSNISYRQRVSWLPPHIEKLFSQIETEVCQKISQGSTIKYVKGRNEFSKGGERWNFAAETPWFIESRAVFSYETVLREFLFEPTQEVRLNKRFSTGLTESLGHISINSSPGTYGAIKPFLTFHSDENRRSTLSYAAGYVQHSDEPIYPMAKEFRRGLNHRIALNLNVKLGKMTTMSGFLRADHNKITDWQTSLSLNAVVKIQ